MIKFCEFENAHIRREDEPYSNNCAIAYDTDFILHGGRYQWDRGAFDGIWRLPEKWEPYWAEESMQPSRAHSPIEYIFYTLALQLLVRYSIHVISLESCSSDYFNYVRITY
jgi:hypothetical protein